MIPLGSCTMKLNAAAELADLVAALRGDASVRADEQARGYAGMLRELEAMLAEITGFAAVSLQPNSGAQGEYANACSRSATISRRAAKARATCA